MTLHDYLHQASNLPIGSVQLKSGEYRIECEVEGFKAIHIPKLGYTYVTKEGDNILYTMGETGLPDKASVFSIQEP